MRVIGIIATAVAGALAVIGVAVGLRSVPDAKRYLSIRSM